MIIEDAVVNAGAVPGKRSTGRRAERTRVQIMSAAERLFGSEGINGPSLRQIAASAGQSNASVIQYHFTDKDGLIREIMAMRVLQMEDTRKRMLQEAYAHGKSDDVATLLRVLCMPHLQLGDANGKYPYSEFLLEFMLRYRGPTASSHPYDNDDDKVPMLTQTLELLRTRLYYMDAQVVSRRSMAAVVIFLHALISATEQSLTETELALRVEDAIFMGAQALTAPLPPKNLPCS